METPSGNSSNIGSSIGKVRTPGDIEERLREESQGKWDALVEPREVTLIEGRIVSPRLYRYEYPTGLTPNAWATGQFCQFLGIPTGYFRRCSVELQDSQFNYWRQRFEGEQAKEKQDRESREGRKGRGPRSERWLIRARNETLRGVLTERYVRLDHLELFAALAPSFSKDYEVDWFALSDESFHLRFHDRRQFAEALPGDRLLAGVHIANSEVGKRAVTVDALVYRIVCTNGLIRKVKGESLLYQRHISLSRPEFARSVQQAIQDALAESGRYLMQLSQSVAYPLRDMEKTLHKLALDWGLTKATEEQVKASLLLEHPSQHETLYGLINGLTGAARFLGPDERYMLETQAGRLLESYLGDAPPPVADRAESTSLLLPSSGPGAAKPPSEELSLFSLATGS